MILLTRIEQFRTLWAMMLPNIPPPEPAWIGRWCVNPDEIIEHAIVRASRKFRSAVPDSEAVWRYVSGVIKSEAKRDKYTQGQSQ
jgi:hypothetical protein